MSKDPVVVNINGFPWVIPEAQTLRRAVMEWPSESPYSVPDVVGPCSIVLSFVPLVDPNGRTYALDIVWRE